MDTTNTAPVFINAFPTPKEQVVSYAVSIALTGATLIAGFGLILVVGKVLDVRADRRLKKETLNKVTK